MRDILFTVGPVEMYPETRKIGSEQLPYFRTQEYSLVNKRIDINLKKCMLTDQSSKTALLTASGTAAMEAAVINIFNEKDKILVISGGSFGKRFIEICEKYHLNHIVLELEQGHTLTYEDLEKYNKLDITGILINIHETSTGVLYDGEIIGEFSKKIGATLVVDAISSFLADEYKMDAWNIDATIISSQKALALPPGMAAVIVNAKTADKIRNNTAKSLYFNLNDYFINMERGQTPYTPAVGITLQMDARLTEILKVGIDNAILNVKKQAQDFRNKIKEFSFTIPSQKLSNAVTPLQSQGSAYSIYEYLKNEYHVLVTPNGGVLQNRLIRIGHIGNLTIEHNDILIEALRDMKNRGIL